MRNIFKSFAFIVMLLAVNAAHATEGLYAGGELLFTKADLLGTSAGGGLFVGYSFNKNLGVEIGYKDLGSYDYDGFPADAQALQASALISQPITENIDIYARLGVTNVHAAVRDSAFSKKATGLHVGIGIQYLITETIKLRAEYQSISKVINQIIFSALLEF